MLTVPSGHMTSARETSGFVWVFRSRLLLDLSTTRALTPWKCLDSRSPPLHTRREACGLFIYTWEVLNGMLASRGSSAGKGQHLTTREDSGMAALEAQAGP